MKYTKLTPILVLFISFLFSCSIYKGPKINSLKETKVAKITLRYDSLLLLPGSTHKVGFMVYTEDGNLLKTPGFLNGTLKWNNFKVEVENAKFSSGKMSITKTKADESRFFIPFKINLKDHPDKAFFDTVWLNYEKSIKIYPINSFKKSPGATIYFGMDIYYDNFQRESYPTTAKLKKVLSNYQVLVKGGTYSNGRFTISSNIFDNPDHKPGMLVQLIKNNNVYDTLDVVLDYKDQYALYGNGGSGSGGSNGSGGYSGLMGKQGQSGQDGQNGYDGSFGHDIDVYTDVYFDSILHTNLVKVYIDDITLQQQQHYLINPEGGNLTVNAVGGLGGFGGNGGIGGNGGKGFEGEKYVEYVKDVTIKKDSTGKEYKVFTTRAIPRQKPGGEGGYGGNGGYGGVGGNGGNGGHIIVYYTPAMKNLLYLFKYVVQGGIGGTGGFGAQGGSGGEGGEGHPKGRNGLNGVNGMQGATGYSGLQGVVDFKEIGTIPW